jgi:8-oxo-dGTP diphosphatase
VSKINIMPTQPLVSIDAVPVLLHDRELHVVLGVRQYEPFAGEAALPGVLLNSNERLAEAVNRALETKIGATNALATFEVGVFDDFERDERGPTLSIARGVILAEEPTDDRVRLSPLRSLPDLPFDHGMIIARAAGALLDALWLNTELTRALLGESFTTADVIARMKELAAAADRQPPVTKNVGRALESIEGIRKLQAAPVGAGRPPAHWEWLG